MRGLHALACFAFCGCGSNERMAGPDAGMDDVDGQLSMPDGSGPPTANELRAVLTNCNVIGGMYKQDEGSGPADIPICGLDDAVFWTADLDVDCDGKETAQCNAGTDISFLPETAASDSMGDPLDASTLPYVVVPLASTRFDYRDHDLSMGSVVAVIFADRVEYGVIGDLGPAAIIGEASYAFAHALGINPDPTSGGIEGKEVLYLAFRGDAAVVDPIEDLRGAVTLGTALARALLESQH